jgi:Cytosol aminopeptidase family, N-terminal domain
MKFRYSQGPALLLAAAVMLLGNRCGNAQSAAATAAEPAEMIVPNAPIPMRVLSQSPADTETSLQVICLFRSDPSNALHGALEETNTKLNGLLEQIREPTLFRGELGETLLITPRGGAFHAKTLLLIGLGDSQSFIPERMEPVGAIVYREADRLGAAHPFFAPTVLDGGVTKFTTGQVSEQFTLGFLRAARTTRVLTAAGGSGPAAVQDLTYLAGPKYASITEQGIEKAVAANSAQ